MRHKKGPGRRKPPPVRDKATKPWIDGLCLARCQITTPCADHACNSVIKFGALRQACLERYGAQYLATGHYAQVVPNAAPGTPPTLRRGLDGNKDQSYFLCTVPADNFHNVGQSSEATLNAHQPSMPTTCPLHLRSSCHWAPSPSHKCE